jgi:hypothetical protein
MLTIGRYAHTRSHDLAAALEALPETATPQQPTAMPQTIVAVAADIPTPEEMETFCGSKCSSKCGSSRAAKTVPEGAIRGQCQGGDETLERDGDHGEADSRNTLQLRDLATIGPEAAERGESENKRMGQDSNLRWTHAHSGFQVRRRTPKTQGKTRVLVLPGSKSAALRRKSRKTCRL